MPFQFNRLVACLLILFAVFNIGTSNSTPAGRQELCEFIPVKSIVFEINRQNYKLALSENSVIENTIADRIFVFLNKEKKKLKLQGKELADHLLYKKTGYESDQNRFSCGFSFDVGLDATHSDMRILDFESQSDPTYRPRFFADNPQARRGQIAFIQYDIHLAYMPNYQLDYISIKKIDLNFVPKAIGAISEKEARMRRLKQHFSRKVVIKARED